MFIAQNLVKRCVTKSCCYPRDSLKSLLSTQVIAAHYEFQFEDTSAVSLLTTHVSPVSEVTLGRPYTLTISLHGSRGPSFFGIITAIDGIHSRHCGTEASSTSEPSASAVFSIWNRNTEAPFGYSPDWTETTEEFTEYNIQLGDTVTLKDRDGRCGTARIASLGGRELNLTNFTGALKVQKRFCLIDVLIHKVVVFRFGIFSSNRPL